MKRVFTQEKSCQNSVSKYSSQKAKSQEAFQRLKSIYGVKHPHIDTSQPMVIGLKIQKATQSPNKLTPRKLRLHIPQKSRTPPQKSPGKGFLTHRAQLKQSNTVQINSWQMNRALQDLKKRLGARVITKANQTQKYFRKEKQKSKVSTEMSETLKMVWDIKQKKPKYQFKMIRRLGKSQAGQIILAKSNVNCVVLAMKTFRKQEIKLDFFIDQSKIHFYCKHPNILPAYGLHIGRQEAFLMMEVGDGNLYDRIVKQAPFSQHVTALYITQVASAVSYLHQAGIMHRDIKPENIICFGKTLKLADFGWSIHTARPRKTLCGTMDYISPQVVKREYYSNKIDCWSIGVLMYQMLTGEAPFPQQQKNPQFDGLIFPRSLSSAGRDMLSKLLDKNPVDRIAARDIRKHQWIQFHLQKEEIEEKKKFKTLRMELQLLLS